MSSGSGESRPAPFETIEGRIAALAEESDRGRDFERAVLHYVVHDPEVEVREAWLWEERPAGIAEGRDLGVDIVGCDDEGELVAIQVKFHRDPNVLIGWDEVRGLLAYRRDLFPRRMLVTNALDRNAHVRTATSGDTDTVWKFRADLADSIHWPTPGAPAAPPEPVVPREPDQVEAIDDTVAALAANERVQLIMACGTGKTLVTRWITEARKDRLVLVLVPTLLLLKQFRRQWRKHADAEFLDIAVCSDQDVVGKDEMRVRTDELGVRVSTDPADIAAFLKGEGRRVVFGTYASSVRIAEAQADPSVPAFDLVVADEAHRVAGITSRGNRTERDTKVVLDGGRIRARRRLFATATPRVYTKSVRTRLEDREDVEFASMDDEEHFGVEAHRLWFKRAVELGRLVDYRLSVVVVTDAEVDELIRERAFLDVQGRRFNAETLAALVAVRRAVDELGVRRVITFHHTIKRAEDFARELERLELNAPPVEAQHVSGSMSMADRQRVLATLEDPETPTVVSNARCLTEGIDVPALGAVAFVDARSAPVDIVQAVGRVMRIAKGKDLGHVIVPVYLTEEQLADPQAAIESSAFEPVLAVLRALRAHDPELVTDATRIATSLGRRDAVVGGYIREHIQVLGAEIDAGGFERALELHYVDVTADRFEVGLAHLIEYASKEGHAAPSSTHVSEDGFPLGVWAGNRRAFYHRGQLPAEQIARLEALPGWVWNKLEAGWQKGYAHLRSYTREHGTANPPQDHVADDGYALGHWVGKQRGMWARGKMPRARREALEALPGWAWNAYESDWAEFISHLSEYARINGHARPSQSHVTPDGFTLGRRVAGWRQAHASGALSKTKADELDSMPGWAWNARDARWRTGIEALLTYVDEHGEASPPRDHVTTTGYPLGGWVVQKRQDYRDRKLSPERASELEALPGWTWHVVDDRWATGLDRLRAYSETTGHSRVPVSHIAEDGFRLGEWVQYQRRLKKLERQPPDRVAALEALPGWLWNPQEADWQEFLSRLREFVGACGHASPPNSYKTDDGYRLGSRVYRSRERHRKGLLKPEQVSALEEIAGWTWEAPRRTSSRSPR